MSRSSHSLVAVNIEPDFYEAYLNVGDRVEFAAVKCPVGHVGFIRELGFYWPTGTVIRFPGNYVEWYVDNVAQPPLRHIVPMMGDWYITAGVGVLDIWKPRVFDPPLVFKHSIRMIAGFNNLVFQLPENFQCIIRGSFYEKPGRR